MPEDVEQKDELLFAAPIPERLDAVAVAVSHLIELVNTLDGRTVSSLEQLVSVIQNMAQRFTNLEARISTLEQFFTQEQSRANTMAAVAEMDDSDG